MLTKHDYHEGDVDDDDDDDVDDGECNHHHL